MVKQEAMIRRYGLWIALNAVTSLVSFAIVSAMCRTVNVWLGRTSSCIWPWLYAVALFILVIQTLVAYHVDTKRFGGTHVRFTALNVWLHNGIQAGLTAVVVGCCLLHPEDSIPKTVESLLTLARNKYLVPICAAKLAVYWFLSSPPRAWSLQEKPGDVFKSYGSQVLAALRHALPRSAIIAFRVMTVLMLLRATERLYFAWLCNGPAQGAAVDSALLPTASLAVCEALTSGTLTLPMYLPHSDSVWGELAAVWLVAFVVSAHLHLLTESLSFVSTYPLDFQKLQSQQAQSGAQSKEGNGDKGVRKGEHLLVDALLIGQDTPVATQSMAVYSGSSGYTERTAIAAAEEQNRRHAQLADSVVQQAHQPAALPYFGEVAPRSKAQRGFKTLVSATSPTSTTSALARPVRSEELLSRALAFQDLHRLSSSSSGSGKARRALLYAAHWAEVVAACTGMIDAAALQVPSSLVEPILMILLIVASFLLRHYCRSCWWIDS